MDDAPSQKPNPLQALRPYVDSEAARRAKRVETVRAFLEEGTKLSDEDRRFIEHLSFTEFPEAITAHHGHAGAVKFASLKSALRLFRASSAALIALLDEFHEFSGAPEFNYPASQGQVDEIETRILKEVFTFSELAHSIQDHCRRVQKVWKVADFQPKLVSHFGADGLHDFILSLRGAVHHITMFEADWELRWNDANERSSHYVLRKKELLEDCEKWDKGESYLAKAPEKIDVRSLVDDYIARHAGFYAWFVPWCEEHPPGEVAEYEALNIAHRRHIVRMEYRFFVQELVKRKIDPMPHLHKYLAPADFAQASALPLHSAELADFVIERYDQHGACDTELRALVYQLFGVP